MKTFELVFNKLSELFIETLQDYILKINLVHNDGIILKNFENKDLLSNCNKLPRFQFSTEEAEYTEKDRIIENTVYSVSLTIYLPPYEENSLLVFWRYVESINRMLEELETDVWHSIEMTKVTKSKMIFRIVS